MAIRSRRRFCAGEDPAFDTALLKAVLLQGIFYKWFKEPFKRNIMQP